MKKRSSLPGKGFIVNKPNTRKISRAIIILLITVSREREKNNYPKEWKTVKGKNKR